MQGCDTASGDTSGLSLAARLQRDSAEAWHDLVELYGPLVGRWASAAGLPAASCEDIVQEVFLAVHRSIGRFDGSAPGATFRGWLWRVTRNAVLQSLRKPHPAAPGGTTAAIRLRDLADPWSDYSDDGPPSTPRDTGELLGLAMRQIESRVEPLTWQAFIRTAVRGESVAAVAESLGLTPAAVRKAKSRTLQRLRKQLGDVG